MFQKEASLHEEHVLLVSNFAHNHSLTLNRNPTSDDSSVKHFSYLFSFDHCLG